MRITVRSLNAHYTRINGFDHTVALQIKSTVTFSICIFCLVFAKGKIRFENFIHLPFRLWISTKRWVSMKRDGFKILCGWNFERKKCFRVLYLLYSKIGKCSSSFAKAFPYSGYCFSPLFLFLFTSFKNYVCVFQFNACSQNILFHFFWI